MLLRRPPAGAVGATLIELMVALLIGLILVAGAVTVYTQSRGTYRVTESAARLQEIARYAMDTIEPDVRLAGYWGLTNDANFVENKATPTDPGVAAASVTNNCGVNWTANVTRFIDGRDAAATGGAGYNLSCTGSSPLNTADILIIRRASSETRPLTNGRVQIQSNRMRAVIFKDGVMPAGFGVAPASETHDLVTNAYYVSDRGVAANGLRQYQLRRQTLVSGAIRDDEVIPGVEDLQVQFGVDVNADGNADRYVNPGAAVLATAKVTSARIWIRVVDEERENGYVSPTYSYANAAAVTPSDNRRRVLFSKTIRIRNSRP